MNVSDALWSVLQEWRRRKEAEDAASRAYDAALRTESRTIIEARRTPGASVNDKSHQQQVEIAAARVNDTRRVYLASRDHALMSERELRLALQEESL